MAIVATQSESRIETIFPLSLLQEQSLLEARRSSGPDIHFRQMRCCLAAEVDLAVWKQAWQTLVDRHAVLRTALLQDNLRKPVQAVLCGAALRWQHWDFRNFREEEQSAKSREILEAERQAAFDLTRPPLLRCSIIETAQLRTFLWSYHAAVLDMRSGALLLKEALEHYERIFRGQPCAPSAAASYRDYVLWCRKHPVTQAVDFWRDTLKGHPAPSFPGQGARLEDAVRPELCAELRMRSSAVSALESLRRAHSLTLQTVMLGVWGILQGRRRGCADVVFGTHVSGRPGDLPGAESMIGAFSNTIPVRIKFRGEVTILEYLRNLQARQLDSVRYQHLPLSCMQQGELAGVSLFEDLLILDPFPEVFRHNLAFNADDALDTGNASLVLVVRERPQMLLQIFCGRARMKEEQAAQIPEQIQALLECLAASASLRVLDLVETGLLGPVMAGAQNSPSCAANKTNPEPRSFEAEIPKLACHRDLPLSFEQQRLWFLNQLSPDDPAYNITTVLRLRGALDHDSLERALNEVVRRHEILRTSFKSENGIPSQSVEEPGRISLSVFRLEAGQPAERELEAMGIARQEAARPFDLGLPFPFRTKLVELGEQDHLLIIAVHHIAADGWSSGIMTREFSLFYEAYSRKKTPLLPDLPVQYGDFAVWQRSSCHEKSLEEGLAYWRKQLGNAPALRLPFDSPPLSSPPAGSSSVYANLDSSALRKIKVFARAENATLFMALLAVFKVVLYAFTWQEDILAGTDIASRIRPELEPLIGFFANQLVLRTRLSGNPTFREILGRVRATTLSAYRHQEVPFDKLVQELAPADRFGPSPLFPVKFVFQNFPNYGLELPGLTCEMKTLENGSAKFPLLLSVAENRPGEGLACLEYVPTLFYAATAAKLLRLFEYALAELSSQPDLSLHSIAEKLRVEEMKEQPQIEALGRRRVRSSAVKALQR